MIGRSAYKSLYQISFYLCRRSLTRNAKIIPSLTSQVNLCKRFESSNVESGNENNSANDDEFDIMLDMDERKFIKSFLKYDLNPEVPRVPTEETPNKAKGNKKSKEVAKIEDFQPLLGIGDKPIFNDKEMEMLNKQLQNDESLKRDVGSSVFFEENGVWKDLNNRYYRRLHQPEDFLDKNLPPDFLGRNSQELAETINLQNEAKPLYENRYGKGLPPECLIDDYTKPQDPLEISEDEDLARTVVNDKKYSFEGCKGLTITTQEYVEAKTWETQQFGENPLNWKGIITIKVKNLPLTLEQRHKLILLAEKRYNRKTGILKITCCDYPSRRQNLVKCLDFLESLIQESKVYTPIEKPKLKMAQCRHDLTVAQHYLAIADYYNGKTKELYGPKIEGIDEKEEDKGFDFDSSFL